MRHNVIHRNGQPETAIGSVTVRRLDAADQPALERLAQLDSSPPLSGRVLGAEVDGRLMAAISLETGELAADPFSHTDELRAMLELRADQLRRRARLGRFALRVRRPRAALAASPPGAGGRLLTLLPRP